MINQIPGSDRQISAPEVLQPTGRWTPAESMDRLRKNYALLTEYLDTTPDLRQHAVDAPPLKAVSKGAYDIDGWLPVDPCGGRAHRAPYQADSGSEGGRQLPVKVSGVA